MGYSVAHCGRSRRRSPGGDASLPTDERQSMPGPLPSFFAGDRAGNSLARAGPVGLRELPMHRVDCIYIYLPLSQIARALRAFENCSRRLISPALAGSPFLGRRHGGDYYLAQRRGRRGCVGWELPSTRNPAPQTRKSHIRAEKTTSTRCKLTMVIVESGIS
jgi:hypothetical protein